MSGGGKKARKVRVQLRKNRGKKSRDPQLSQQSADELADLSRDERLSGKGGLTRFRTIIASDADAGTVARDVDAAAVVPGRVLRSMGGNDCEVQLETGDTWRCSVRRVLRTLSQDARGAVVAGDRVLVAPTGAGAGVIERVEPRHGTLSRVSRGAEHIIVANVDQAVIVASVAQPQLKLGLIDRFLCSTDKGGIAAIICINKIDLGDAASLQPVIGQYTRMGYPVFLTDALTGRGIDELRDLLAGRETVFTGQSGVGKSSLLNAVQPGLGRSTGGTSEDSGKGRHTTRVTELIQLSSLGGWVVDTPGIRQLELWQVAREEVEGHFVEFRPFVADCRFPDCTHTHESDCGIRAAVTRGMISPLRYASYQRIFAGDAE